MVRDQLLGKRKHDQLPTTKELTRIAEEIDSERRTRGRTPPTPAKTFKTHFKKFLRPDQPEFRVKYSATAKSNVVDEAKAVLHHEYLIVKMSKGKFGFVKNLAAHYQVGTDWFASNAAEFEATNSFRSAKWGSRGGHRKWDDAMSGKFRRVNKQKYSRRASNTTMAPLLGVDRRTVDRNLKKEEYKYKRIKPRPKLTEQNIIDRKAFSYAVLKDNRKTRHKCWIDCTDIDEKIWKLPGFSGKLRYHNDSDPESDDEQLHPQCQSKRFIPGIMCTLVFR